MSSSVSCSDLGAYFDHQATQLLERSMTTPEGEVAHTLWLWSLDIKLMAEICKHFHDGGATGPDIHALLTKVAEVQEQIKSELQRPSKHKPRKAA